jgi:hypothetical protein
MTSLSFKGWVESFSKECKNDPRMKPYFDRLKWNKSHFWDFKSFNPYVSAGEGGSEPKNRTGIQDFGHSLKNIGVEWQRLKNTT